MTITEKDPSSWQESHIDKEIYILTTDNGKRDIEGIITMEQLEDKMNAYKEIFVKRLYR